MKIISITVKLIAVILLFGSCQSHISENNENGMIWQSDAYEIYADSVVQGQYVSRVLSGYGISSNYKSPANEFVSPRITFKFSINGKDNEMISGKDHHFNCLDSEGPCETPIITFGEQYVDQREISENTFLDPNKRLHIRLDMRKVFSDFEEKGFYETFNGEKIYKEDFKGVYVAGSTYPLIWDFDNLINHPELELKDEDGDGIYELELLVNVYNKDKITASTWTLNSDISSFPRYYSDYPLLNALYNMSLEEMVKDIEADSTFRTGKEWAGVWTRDISYSLILSMASLQPEVSEKSLMRKVKNDRIIQDTGTGGAYPVSTDRIVWAVAAWELYKTTGDNDWLTQSYSIIRNSFEDDLKNAYDEKTGLFRGESSFLDWREQTYPEWMQPADIYNSENLGTNAVFFQAGKILSEMAKILGEKKASEKYAAIAESVKNGINKHLWIEDSKFYGQYLYGRNYKTLSPRAEALGEALTVLFDVAEESRQKEVVANTPVMAFGIPSIYPQIPNIPPYHNNGIWPFVQAYWSLAAAKAGNEKALTESINAIYRPAALFLTNKENFVASTGDYVGTQINSNRQLWSVAGNLAIVYKIFFGMDFQTDKIVFKPFVPKIYKGNHILKNFQYRNSTLDINLQGYGNKIKSFAIDGKLQDSNEVPSDLQGKHTIDIVLANNDTESQNINLVAHHVSPAAPKVTIEDNRLVWEKQEGSVEYKVLENGKRVGATNATSYRLTPGNFSEYQVIAIDEAGYESFTSEPVRTSTDRTVYTFQMEQFAKTGTQAIRGYTGDGFVELSKMENTDVPMVVEVPESGLYFIDFRYANGSGPINTDNKAAVRTLLIDDTRAGTIVLPQRGSDEWSDWGFTNSVPVELDKGKNTIRLSFLPPNENMNGEVNNAMVDFVRLTLAGKSTNQ